VKDTFFGISTKYDTGVQPAVALNEQDLVVEVHQSEGLSNRLWYRVGRLQPDLNVLWLSGTKAIHYDYGVNPSIALANDGTLVEVHNSQTMSLGLLYGWGLWYRVGRIAADYKIEWLSDSKSIQYDSGVEPVVSLRQDKLLVELHSSDKGELFYRLGKIGDDWKIDWISGGPGIKFGAGSAPAVAVGDNDRVVAIDHLKGAIRYRVGQIRSLQNDIVWINPEICGKGDSPSVAMTRDGFVIEIHRMPGMQYSLASRVGQCRDRGIEWQREAAFFDDGMDPAVACNSRGAIQVHSSDADSESNRTHRESFVR
jgi:hypothetical protein